jgi:hypothetical protein
VPPRLAAVTAYLSRLVEDGGRVAVRCRASDDPATLLAAVAGRLGLAVPAASRAEGLAALLHRLGLELPAVVLRPGETPPDGTVLALGAVDLTVPEGWHGVDVDAPPVAVAERLWRTALRGAGLRPAPAEVSALAGRLPLGEAAILAVVERACAAAAARGERPTVRDAGTALRHQPQHDPAGLARRIAAELTLDDLVLPGATRTALEEVVAHGRYSTAAHETLGLTGERGRAVVALFHGPSGTGKTAAAEAVASALDRDLWVVDLAQVVSKWLGETQRHLDTLLSDAAAAGVVLLFDEADGLFGKRGEVTDARDRYANLEIDHLLQRIELHTGVVVLTSNRPAALDDAFLRRLRLSVRFDPPDHTMREELWRRFLPRRLLADGVDTSWVAREELPGASIRAAALDAAVLALADSTAVTAEHLAAAVRRELEKTRRPLTARGVPS